MSSEHWSGIDFFYTYVDSLQSIHSIYNKADGDWFIDPVGIISLPDRFFL